VGVAHFGNFAEQELKNEILNSPGGAVEFKISFFTGLAALPV